MVGGLGFWRGGHWLGWMVYRFGRGVYCLLDLLLGLEFGLGTNCYFWLTIFRLGLKLGLGLGLRLRFVLELVLRCKLSRGKRSNLSLSLRLGF